MIRQVVPVLDRRIINCLTFWTLTLRNEKIVFTGSSLVLMNFTDLCKSASVNIINVRLDEDQSYTYFSRMGSSIY